MRLIGGFFMRSQAIAQGFVAVLLSLALAACSGGGGGVSIGSGTGTGGISSSSGSSGSSSSGSSSGGAVSTPDYRLGNLNGGTFTAGAIFIQQSPLAAGGSSGLHVEIVDINHNNTLYTASSVQVVFNSPCISAGTSVITSPVTTSTGSATTNYIAQGCSGDDPITATVAVEGVTLSATGTITVQPASLSSITKVSVTPNTIGFKGSGLNQTATVVFKVINTVGGPVPGQTVNFTLDNTNGGITLNPASGKTGPDGTVQTVVTAGTVATATTVVASTPDGTIKGRASVAIGTGISANDAFSFSVKCPNVEGLNIDGNTTTLNMLDADHFGAAVLDGTSISFTTDGGSLSNDATSHSPSCSTVNGACSIVWTSQDPRPANGRAVILASANGEESYKDLNGNGFYDCTGVNLTDSVKAGLVAQGYTFGSCPGGEPFKDLSEAWRDDNENGVHDSSEEFVDFNLNGVFDAPDGKFTGPLCNGGSAACSATPQLSNFRNLVVVMSGSSAAPGFFNPSTNVGTYDPATTTFTLPAGQTAILSFTIADVNNNPMPGQTVVSATTSGAGGSISGTSSFVYPCTSASGGVRYSFVVVAASGTGQSAVFDLKVTAPSGLITDYLFTINT
jgi:hypothetical protein